MLFTVKLSIEIRMKLVSNKIPIRGTHTYRRQCNTNVLQEGMKFGMRTGIISDLKQRFEQIVQQILKVLHQSIALVDVTERRYRGR